MEKERKKRYQVFVSSTFLDLREERKEVIQGLLELDCMPAGMELFPAADSDPLTVIKKVIDDSDYYVVIVGGRNGSIAHNGKSFTRVEYEYALSQNKPILAFTASDVDALSLEKVDIGESRRKLDQFRDILHASRLCKQWTTSSELAAGVTRKSGSII